MKFKQWLEESRTSRVPRFNSRKEMEKFLSNMTGSERAGDHIMDPETGEIIIEKGQTKKNALKKGVPKYLSGRIHDADKSFEEVYRFVEAPISKITGNSGEGTDYDTSINVPKLISRKDNLPINEADMTEIELWLSEIERERLRGKKMSLVPSQKGRQRVEVSISFR